MLSQPQGPLPDPQFIVNNRPMARAVQLTTCTKDGKAAAAKKRKVDNSTGGTKDVKNATTKKSKVSNKIGVIKEGKAAAAKKNARGVGPS